jgi:hypothetical protein
MHDRWHTGARAARPPVRPRARPPAGTGGPSPSRAGSRRHIRTGTRGSGPRSRSDRTRAAHHTDPAGKSVPLRTTAPVSPTRRAVLQTIATILALAAVAVLAGCGTSTTPTPGATADRVAPSTTPTPGATAGRVAPSTQVMIIRHGKKPDDTNPGVDANGNQNDTSLTELARWALFTYLMLALCLFSWAAARPAPPAGPGSAAVLAGGGTSTTPTPGATAGGVAPSTLVMVIRHGKKPGPDDRFDVVWTLAKTADGWHFPHTPEPTLPRTRPASSKKDHQPRPGDSRPNGRDDHHTA